MIKDILIKLFQISLVAGGILIIALCVLLVTKNTIKRVYKYVLLPIIIILTALCTLLCTLLSLLHIFMISFCGNTTLTNDNVYISGLLTCGIARYGTVDVDWQQNNAQIVPEFALEFKNGQRIIATAITRDYLLKMNPIKYQEQLDDDQSPDLTMYSIDDGNFYFSGQRLVRLTINSGTLQQSGIKIGDSAMKKFSPLPMTAENCKKLFGESLIRQDRKITGW